MGIRYYWANLKGGSVYLAPKVFSTNILITPPPNNLSSKGLGGILLGFTDK